MHVQTKAQVSAPMQSVFISGFKVVKPQHCIAQDALLPWFVARHQEAEGNRSGGPKTANDQIQKLFQHYAVKPNKISQRYFDINDMVAQTAEREIYRFDATHEFGATNQQRNTEFAKHATRVFQQLYEPDTNTNPEVKAPQDKRPDQIIHVTCTGYVSPSAPQKLVSEPGWGAQTDVTHAYHMGCYAAIPAIRTARAFVSSESETQTDYSVDVVHTEVCSLHLNPLAHTPEQMIVQSLFADGHIKYTLHGGSLNRKKSQGKQLKILTILERVLPDSSQDMSWIPAPWGMQMNLSRHVPAKIKGAIAQFNLDLFAKAKLPAALMNECIYAIHPGGPKIIDGVSEVLGLSADQINESNEILYERGNMSSATLPHVWNAILLRDYSPGTKVVSFAFGPGLTIFGAIFEIIL